MSKEITIEQDGVRLQGIINAPSNVKGWVVFAYGSGSSRRSKRNLGVANKLNQAGFATLLFDLLTAEEDVQFENRFDIPLLSERLVMAMEWLMESPYYLAHLPIALFGASTGTGAALMAANLSQHESRSIPLKAIISRGGRPDLAGVDNLKNVHVPTLLIVGSLDTEVIQLNQIALRHLTQAKLLLVKGASHLFEEPGTLDEVVNLSIEWLDTYLDVQSSESSAQV